MKTNTCCCNHEPPTLRCGACDNGDHTVCLNQMPRTIRGRVFPPAFRWVEPSAVPPENPEPGITYVNTTDDQARTWDGKRWVIVTYVSSDPTTYILPRPQPVRPNPSVPHNPGRKSEGWSRAGGIAFWVGLGIVFTLLVVLAIFELSKPYEEEKRELREYGDDVQCIYNVDTDEIEDCVQIDAVPGEF